MEEERIKQIYSNKIEKAIALLQKKYKSINETYVYLSEKPNQSADILRPYENKIGKIWCYIHGLEDIKKDLEERSEYIDGRLTVNKGERLYAQYSDADCLAYIEALDKGFTKEDVNNYQDAIHTIEENKRLATVTIKNEIGLLDRLIPSLKERYLRDMDINFERDFRSQDQVKKKKSDVDRIKKEVEFIKKVNDFDGSKKQFELLQEELEKLDPLHSKIGYEDYFERYANSKRNPEDLTRLKRYMTEEFGLYYDHKLRDEYTTYGLLPESTKEAYKSDSSYIEALKQGKNIMPYYLPEDFKVDYNKIMVGIKTLSNQIELVGEAEAMLEDRRNLALAKFYEAEELLKEEQRKKLAEKGVSEDSINRIVQNKYMPDLYDIKNEYTYRLLLNDVNNGMAFINYFIEEERRIHLEQVAKQFEELTEKEAENQETKEAEMPKFVF